MKFYRKITGERLYLSPFSAGDEEIHAKWAEWMNNRAVSEYFGGYHLMVTQESAKKTIGEFEGYRFVIVLKENDELIGHISLHNIDHLNRNAFLGIFIGPDERRGKGYGTEAVRLILGFGFKTLNMHNIMLTVHADAAAAVACYKKAGFTEAGRLREWIYKDGKYVDKLYMGILCRDYAGRG